MNDGGIYTTPGGEQIHGSGRAVHGQGTPNTSAIEYKCRRCNSLYTLGEGKPGDCEDAVCGAVQGQAFRGHSVSAQMYRIHQCDDGGVGVGDLIGVRHKPGQYRPG